MPWGHPRAQEEALLLSSGLPWYVTSNPGLAQRTSKSSEDNSEIFDGPVQSQSCCGSWQCHGDTLGDRRRNLHPAQASAIV